MEHETIIKILCQPKDLEAFMELLPTGTFVKAVLNDPDWGFTGSQDSYVVYLNNSSGFFTESAMFWFGTLVGEKRNK
jgi:hypothetical protein